MRNLEKRLAPEYDRVVEEEAKKVDAWSAWGEYLGLRLTVEIYSR